MDEALAACQAAEATNSFGGFWVTLDLIIDLVMALMMWVIYMDMKTILNTIGGEQAKLLIRRLCL